MTCSIPEPISANPAIQEPVQSTRFVPGATTLAEMTTIGVGGPVTDVVHATTQKEMTEAIREADDAGRPLLVVGGGSNILASDEGFDGVVVHDERSSIETVMEDGCGGAQMRVTAGTPWDEAVAYAVEHEWMGLEALSGIPGSTGAAPVQNIGAYGQELSETLASVKVYDRKRQRVDTLFLSDLKFGYRDSVLKRSMNRGWGASPQWIVLEVLFHMRRASNSRPITYKQLADHLGVEVGARVPSSEVRAAVLDLRRSKGMVLDDADRDTFSLGSFFTNPILSDADAASLPDDAPRYPVTDGTKVNQIAGTAPVIPGVVKTSAAWLIEHAGFQKGYGTPPATLSTKHTLALTNRGGATAEQIAALAREIQSGVADKFGVELRPEPVTVGIEL